jgi:hypothetical protein
VSYLHDRLDHPRHLFREPVPLGQHPLRLGPPAAIRLARPQLADALGEPPRGLGQPVTPEGGVVHCPARRDHQCTRPSALSRSLGRLRCRPDLGEQAADIIRPRVLDERGSNPSPLAPS